jgi:hypothetical protein
MSNQSPPSILKRFAICAYISMTGGSVYACINGACAIGCYPIPLSAIFLDG